MNGEVRYVSISRDITERRHSEQRLEVFNRILRHNLRNQLDVIRGHAEGLVPIEAETETCLQHGRGLGLWQLRWCVDNLNGKLSFGTGAGTTVRIRVPDRSGSSRSD